MPVTGKWITKDIAPPVPEVVPQTIGAVSGIADAYNSLLGLIQEALKLLASVNLDNPSLTEKIVNDLLNQLSDFIDSYTKPAALHALAIAPGLFTNLDWKSMLSDSLSDRFDPGRPLYTEDESVIGLIILAYEPVSKSGLSTWDIYKTIQRYSHLIGLSNMVPWDGFSLKAPQNFRARLITKPRAPNYWEITSDGDNGQPLAIKLTWDPPSISYLTNLSKTEITGITIYRSVDTPLPNVDTADGYADYVYVSKTINILNSEINTFIDKDIEDGKTYFYSISYQYKDTPDEAIPVATWEKVKTTNPIVATKEAVPPNWHSVTNPLMLWPGLYDIVSTTKQYIDRSPLRASTSSSHGDLITKQADVLGSIINQQQTMIDRLKRLQTNLSQMLNMTAPAGVGLFPFKTKGTTGIKNAFLNAFDETNSSLQLSSTSPSTALVLVSGGKTEAELGITKQIFDWITGGTSYNVFDSFFEDTENIFGDSEFNLEDLAKKSKETLDSFKNKLHTL